MPRIKCKECGEVKPVLKYQRKLIDPETKICWHCKEETKERDE
ncbi:hypothetical protein [endosymbiont GvMRE of Glomus versiforme]|nr:hypothetical protein [endosymbiont GvMRE of Glomus versiforme]RHZ37436.1 hypothetical protein GvMRE_I1g553 [endosymbiont GvMRE of Glomus versiforme]